MKDTLVVYFSRTGSNHFLAHQIASDLEADIERIIPRLNMFFPQLMASLSGMGLGNKKMKKSPGDYDKVVLVGPIWMGKLIAPLFNFLKRHIKQINKLYVATCCGSTDDIKDEKFGYGLVFDKIRDIAGSKLILSQAFPIVMVVPDDKKNDDNYIMKARLNDYNFVGKIKERYDHFLLAL